MKKIYSLIVVLAMMMCCSVTSFASNDAPFSFATETIDVALGEGTENVEVTLNIAFDDEMTIGAANITFDTAGLSVVDINSDDLAKYVPRDAGGSVVADGMITHIDMNNFATGTIPAGETVKVIATLAVDKSVEATYVVTLTGDTLILGDDFETPINDGVTYPSVTIAVKAEEIGGGEEEEESHEVASAEREAVTEKATHQIGTAVGMKVTTPEDIAFTKMIWAIANGSERLYAKNIVELPKLSGDIWVAATFVNGSHNDVYENAKVVAPLTIGENDFDAIFYGVDADGNYVADYFTNEAADKKAE